MEVLWLEGAITDLDEIVGYIAQRNQAAASKTAAALYDAASLLSDHPRMGRKGRVPGTRELVVSRLPFVVAYRIRLGRVEVLRVIHGRRHWDTVFREQT
jgi:plasmid stabilization system protein ParE